MTSVSDLLAPFPRAALMGGPTPLERLGNLSEQLDLDLWIKRDDLTGLSLGGNKTRQLEFYIGAARASDADTILITGAVQSNFARTAAVAASKYGMHAILQREERVPDMDPLYYRSGNVFLSGLMDAEDMQYPVGEDEAGADAALAARAESLRAQGRTPYIIPLGIDHPPLGALGYVSGGAELAGQCDDFDVAVVPSGSGATHGGFLTGLRLSGIEAPVYGICVRRTSDLQLARMQRVCQALTKMLGIDPPVADRDILTWDGALAPGYGRTGEPTRQALWRMVQSEGILLDPVYSAKTFAGLLGLLETGQIKKGQKVVLLHTGGQAALFAYQTELSTSA